MRSPIHLFRALVILLVLGFAARAHADDRSDARAHYQSAVKFYSGGDYRSAIREFSAAQQLVPADLNNYNLALCYDKLGDAEPAIQYYRAFLEKQPNTDKRAEIEASVARLDAAVKSAASKKADEAKKAEAARKAEEAKRPVLGPSPSPDAPPTPPTPVLGPALPPASAGGPAGGPAVGPSLPDADAPVAEAPKPAKKKKKGPAVGGSLPGVPSGGGASGDPQLDRVNAINLDEIRDQHRGPDARGPRDARDPRDPRGPSVASADPQASSELGPSNGQPDAASNGFAPTAVPASGSPDEPKKESPVYKKWWFWAVVAVGAYVAYEVVTTDSKTDNRARMGTADSSSSRGMTLLRW